jgi:hypothetical protein
VLRMLPTASSINPLRSERRSMLRMGVRVGF